MAVVAGLGLGKRGRVGTGSTGRGARGGSRAWVLLGSAARKGVGIRGVGYERGKTASSDVVLQERRWNVHRARMQVVVGSSSGSGASNEDSAQILRKMEAIQTKIHSGESKRKVDAEAKAPAPTSTSSSSSEVAQPKYNGIFALLLINVVIFLLDNQAHVPWIKSLYLNHAHPRWWQFVTANFCHMNYEHLSNNAVMLYLFGKLVEEEEGSWGVVFYYLITGIGSMVANYLLIPSTTGGGFLGFGGGQIVSSIGASGAVFGMFTISVLLKLRFRLKNILEVGILAPFVWSRVQEEIKMQISGGNPGVSHIAHMAGALVGVLLVWMVSRLPAPEG